MRRTTLVFLVVVGILAIGVRFFVSERLPSENPPGMEIQFVEYGPFNQLSTSNSPLAQIQSSIDRISEAAMKGQWTTATRAVQQLDHAWQGLTPREANDLESEREIEAAIQTLYLDVWGQDEQGVLATAQKLTALIAQLER
ncbi:MAG TPA: hypothetical protein DDW87_12770 [Firmicutes bacterium]|nr:hypothetical protein [Bacillota bacterium]